MSLKTVFQINFTLRVIFKLKTMLQTYNSLIDIVKKTLKNGRINATLQVNNILTETYWQVGKHIVDFEQNGENKAIYGDYLLTQLSKDLRSNFGKGFSRRNLSEMRRFYLTYPIWQTVSAKLTWSHYVELISISDELSRSFYEKQSILDKWSVRELKRQKNSALFERLALSKDKKAILQLAKKGQIIEQVSDIIKDPYIFEFLDFPDKQVTLERDFENEIINKLSHFLLELGKGFAFVGKQYRITIDNTHFYIDLVFYHRILKCFVLIDLKIRKVTHQDIGQMNLYLNYFKIEESVSDDNPPIGIILAADKNDILVEFATAGISNQLFVSKYQVHLPQKELLKEQLANLLKK